MTQKETWFLLIQDGARRGIGECGLLRGLSFDDVPQFEEKLRWVCDNITLGEETLWEQLRDFPAIQFGVETAFRSLKSEHPFLLFPSEFTSGKGIPINGLVWMGDARFMKEQIQEKLATGFSCVKLKIGAIDFDQELALLESIRKNFPADQIEIRVDANGAFSTAEAMEKLERLAEFDLHSIEQPIKAGQIWPMHQLCRQSPVPIALDEELIGVTTKEAKENLLMEIRPPYIILKPSLVGGFRGSQEWIAAAESLGIEWWATSALESNVGLNAIAQWTYQTKNQMPQGLGTGSLYTNNCESPLLVKDGHLHYDPDGGWDLSALGLGDFFHF